MAIAVMQRVDPAVYRVLLRLERGEKVEPSRATFGGMRLADELRQRGVVAIATSPKGRKRWYVLTVAGEAMLPAAHQWKAAEEKRALALRSENDMKERIYQAGPKCYEYVRALANNGDENAVRFLADLGL